MIVAILLALLFRGFEAEAFIIPTGSMAPTLQGMHKDLRCPECNFRYRANQRKGVVVKRTTCPMCRFETAIIPDEHPSYNGDRIIVNKFAYEVADPERWDCIVFKFPGNAKQNYIKRLVGLPNETIKIRGGDVFAKEDGASEFTILRKPVEKIPFMLQLVHDTRYIPEKLIQADWPARWHTVESDGALDGETESWTTSEDRTTYRLESSGQTQWLRYRHLPPVNRRTRRDTANPPPDEWSQILAGKKPHPTVPGRLIRDWYAYNAAEASSAAYNGLHWVGDLAVAARLEIATDEGEFWLDLVEGGEHYRCHVDVATGIARCEVPGGPTLSAQTPVSGKGTYRVMWANLDNQVLLWVNDHPMQWQADGQPHPGHYDRPELVGARWSPEDPGDLKPAGLGGKNITLTASKLKIYRDIYYTATYQTRTQTSARFDRSDYNSLDLSNQKVIKMLVYPPVRSAGAAERMFASRRETIEFQLEEDQFFPMGDNSPQSKDGRLWAENDSAITGSRKKFVDNYVARDVLIGKAIIVYWPHGWSAGPIRVKHVEYPIPNVDRMGKIR